MTTKKNNGRPDKSNRETDLDNLTLSSPPAFDSFYIQEPKLVFGSNLSSVDPKTGIEQFGPFASIKSRIRIGAIGTGTGIDAFRLYLERAQQPIRPGLNSRGKHYDSLYVPDFPGVNASSSFRCNFVTEPALQRAIPEGLYENAVKPLHPSVKLKQVVDLIVKELEALSDREPEPDVVAVIMPPIVEKECATVGAAFRGTRLVLTPVQQLERRLERLRRRT